jgi:hypothetical protein
MRRNIIWQLAMMSLFAAWGLSGCDSPSTPAANEELVTREQTVDLDDEYGGFNFGDESPAFADPMLAVDYGPDEALEFADPMDGDPAVLRIRDRYRPRTFLMVTWGNLESDSTIDFVTDWTGGLSVENGVAILRRTIRFDFDDVILPRTSRDTIEWISHTRPSFDGVLVELHHASQQDTTPDDSARVDVAAPEPMAVTFKTGPLTVTIMEKDLVDLHRVVAVDDAGNAVAFNTITVIPEECPNGFLAGQWKSVTGRPDGVFRGKWISSNGVHMGYLRGVYGPNSRGEKVFFGKWITEGGRFQGLLRGHYGVSDDRPGGWFEGEWLGSNLRVMGALRGVYGTRDTGGFFRGTWKMRCPS